MHEHLMAPGRIGPMELSNRILMAAMGAELGDEGGFVNDRQIAYYAARARGGAGCIVLETSAVAYPRGATAASQIGLSDDRFLPGLTKLAAAIHAEGAKAAVQFTHHGKTSRVDTAEGRALLVPSVPRFHGAMDMAGQVTRVELEAMIAASGGKKPEYHEATPEDLDELVECFADAAARVERAGFDGIEIHAAHGYILSSFLSPAWNFREDAYGGDHGARSRLLAEVITAIKARTEGRVAVWCRIDAKEYRIPGGIELEEALQTAQVAEAAGADAIHVSAYADPTSGAGFTDGPLVDRAGAYLDYAKAVKGCVSVPVIAVGRVESDVADRVIADGGADFVAMARKLLADPDLPRKLAEGTPERVRPCIYCYQCVAQAFFDRPVICSVNAETGREHEVVPRLGTPVAEPKHVLVVGGGPAGLEAARVASLRGHRVTLCEKQSRLGGTLFFAGLVYEPNERLANWLAAEARAAGSTIHLDTEATPEWIRGQTPDIVLVATGAERALPDVPGADGDHVFSGDDLRGLLTGDAGAEAAGQKLGWAQRAAVRAGRALGVTDSASQLRELSKRWMPLGKRVTVLGGGLVGLELAEFLAERGREVTVLEEGRDFAPEMAMPRRWRILDELRTHGVTLRARTRLVRIEPDAVVVEHDEKSDRWPADAVVVATGVSGKRSLADAIAPHVPEVRVIGDADGVGYIHGAIRAGFDAALEV
ncbi:MAG: FAD-dependent oxidoreductase [Myxococcota bacterium]